MSISKIKNFILRLFGIKHTTPVVFSYDYRYGLDIQFPSPSISEHDAKNIASFLVALQNGKLQTAILDKIVKISSLNINNEDLIINEIYNNIDPNTIKHTKKYKDLGVPLVRPRAVFGNV